MLHIIVYCILKGLIPQSHTQLSARKHVSLAGKFFLHCFWPNATQISRKWGHVLARFGHLCQIANHTLNAHTWEYWRRTMATTKTNTPWPMTKMWYHIKGCKCAICSTISLIKKYKFIWKCIKLRPTFFVLFEWRWKLLLLVFPQPPALLITIYVKRSNLLGKTELNRPDCHSNHNLVRIFPCTAQTNQP